MKQLYKVLFIFFLIYANHYTQAQITINSGITAQQIIDALEGSGVEISNVTINCNNQAYGDFDNGDPSIPMDKGIIMGSGAVSQAAGPSSNHATIPITPAPGGDAQLEALLLGLMGGTPTTHDVCIIEFDFVPSGGTLNFPFTFASEEYILNPPVGGQTGFECGTVNDVFAFFINGPNPAGGTYVNKNLAVTPCGGASCPPVTINTINAGTFGTANGCDPTNSAYYQDNSGNATLAYNGYTIDLVASESVVPCQTYHLVLKIADGGDAIYDSAVFIEQLASGTIFGTSTLNSLNMPSAVEGCADAIFKIEKPATSRGTFTYSLSYGGTATPFYDPNPDYIVLDASTNTPYTNLNITVSNADPIKELIIRPLDDGISDNLENVTLAVQIPVCVGASSDTLVFFDVSILDDYPALIGNDTLVFCGSPLELEANDADFYIWSEEGTIVQQGFDFPPTADIQRKYEITSIADTTHYNVRIAGATCWLEKDFVVIPGYIEVEEENIEICPGQDTLLVAYGNQTYEWVDDAGNVLSTGDTCLVNPSVNTVYTVTGNNRGCINTTTVNVQVIESAGLDIPTLEDWYCSTNENPITLTGQPAGGDFTIEGITDNTILINSVGIPINFTPNDLPTGDYKITYSYAHPTLGCVASYTETFLLSPSNPQFQGLPEEICSTGTPLELANYIFSPENLPLGTFSINDPNGASVSTFDPNLYEEGSTQTVYYNDGCASINTEIDVISSIEISEPTGLEICSNSGLVLTLDAGVEAFSYVWYEEDSPNFPLSAERTLDVEEKGVYLVIVEDNSGCVSEGRFEVGEGCNPKFFIPDAFSPNGDGVNDEFRVFGQDFVDFKIQIFNRWGEVVFYTDEYPKIWDGTYRGNIVPAGTYTCIYQYRELPDGELQEKRSKLLIIK